MTEAEIQTAVWKAVGARPDFRCFRNNVGVLFDRTGRPVRYGVGGNGGSDLLGLKSLVVTADMVGTKLGVFTALEVKTPAGKPTPEQTNFLAFVRSFGGIADVVRSPEDAVRLVSGGSV